MIFNSPYDQYKERNGQLCEILNIFSEPDANHDAEVLPMYEIRFRTDNTIIEAYPEELHMVDKIKSMLKEIQGVTQ